jgi:hypothetical protein
MFPDSNARRSHRIARILHYPVFSFRLAQNPAGTGEYNGKDELYEVVDAILTDLPIEMTETVFVDWMIRLQRLINGNGDDIS